MNDRLRAFSAGTGGGHVCPAWHIAAVQCCRARVRFEPTAVIRVLPKFAYRESLKRTLLGHRVEAQVDDCLVPGDTRPSSGKGRLFVPSSHNRRPDYLGSFLANLANWGFAATNYDARGNGARTIADM